MKYIETMPKLSPARKKEVEALQRRVKKLYDNGLKQKDISLLVGRSMGWVSETIKKLSTDNEKK